MSVISSYIIPVSVSLIIHGLVIGVLLVKWDKKPEPKRIIPPKYIEAKLVQLEDKTKNKASAKKQPKKIDLTAKRRAQELQKKEAEKKRQAEIKRKKALEAKKAAEKKKKEEALATKKREEDELRKKERRRLQQEFDQALKEEQGMLLEEQTAIEAQSYKSKIMERIQANWNRPPSARTGMTCQISIQLVPTGRIVDAQLVESSGNAVFDRSAIQAVKKVETFEVVKQMKPEVFERHYRKFTVLFNPQDLRL